VRLALPFVRVEIAMRTGLTLLLVVLFAVFGAVFGALNAETITVDLYVRSVSAPKGAALLAALMLGWLCGGCLVWFARGRRERRRVKAAVAAAVPPPPAAADEPVVPGGA
jgi:putative membrane protein